jgi:glycosyltransferase involved in cell wall biosynthesis
VQHRRYAFICGVPVGVGGLGVQAGNALRALALNGHEVHAIGPAPDTTWHAPPNVIWHVSPRSWTPYFRWTPLRRRSGVVQHLSDYRIGRFAGDCVERLRPDLCYGFTQVSLEALQWAEAHGVTSVLESPNGHLRSFRQVYVNEAQRWCNGGYLGHPTDAMVRRVEDEYHLASHVRVSSEWARASLAAGGVPATKITVLQQPVDLKRYTPRGRESQPAGALRVCFVGSLDLRKGFVYLLRAAREMGDGVCVEFVGGTGDRCCRRLLERERAGVDVRVAPGDPRPALARADVFALPTLEDGSPFAVAEAMASGLPVVTTTATGAAEWIRAGQTGWLTEPASDVSLAAALLAARNQRRSLPDMGRAARADTERRIQGCDEALSAWVQAQ